jgi:hypothetical protein
LTSFRAIGVEYPHLRFASREVAMKRFSSLMIATLAFALGFCFAPRTARAQGSPGGLYGVGMEMDSPKEPGDVPPDEVLSKNPSLAEKLHGMLPADLKVMDAAQGYKKFRDFTTALHIAQDLSLPFVQLKCTELGGKFCTPQTKTKGKGLADAVMALKPSLDKSAAKDAEKKAAKEAKGDTP